MNWPGDTNLAPKSGGRFEEAKVLAWRSRGYEARWGVGASWCRWPPGQVGPFTVLGMRVVAVVLALTMASGGCGGESPGAQQSLSSVVVGRFNPAQSAAVNTEAAFLTGAGSVVSEHAWISFDYRKHEVLVQWCDEGSAHSNAGAVARELTAANVFRSVRIEKRPPSGMGNC